MTQASPERPVRVVLVDDHAMFRAGVRAELAASGAGAVEVVGEAADVDTAVRNIAGSSTTTTRRRAA